MSDLCGIPDWYQSRVDVPVKPHGIQYVSEHIVRCRYSQDWNAIPWLAVYSFNFVLAQVLYTWVRLHVLHAVQAHKMQTLFPDRTGVHFLFIFLLFLSLLGLVYVIEFNYQSTPSHGTDQFAPLEWMDHSYFHYAGVITLLFSYFAMHLLVIHHYIHFIYNVYDYQNMCGVHDLTLVENNAAWNRRAFYVSLECLYAVVVVLFVVFFYWHQTLAVVSEYILVLFVLGISIYNLFISYRLESLYKL